MSHFQFPITVGAVVEDAGNLLVVRLDEAHRFMLTQPAGHALQNELLLDALTREVHEETGYHVEPVSLIGVYDQRFNDSHSLRFSFVCHLRDHKPDAPSQDPEVSAVLWLSREELAARRSEFRPGATAATFDDYFKGRRFALDVLRPITHTINRSSGSKYPAS